MRNLMYNVRMNINPLYITYALIGVTVILSGLVIHLEIKVRRLLAGKNAQSLEDTIVSVHKKLDMLSEFRKDSLAYFTDIEKRLRRSVQSVETVRFNPFKGTGDGGNNSFSTALITEEGNGVIITGLYSRDRVSIFSKPLRTFSSEFELATEENDVLEAGRKNIQK